MTGVHIGSNVEKERNRGEREDAWRPSTPIREQPMPPQYTVTPCTDVQKPTKPHSSTLVGPHARSLSVATTCGVGAAPTTADPTHQPNPAPPPILVPANEYPTSSSRVRVRVRVQPTSPRRQLDVCTSTTPASCRRSPPPSMQSRCRLRHNPPPSWAICIGGVSCSTQYTNQIDSYTALYCLEICVQAQSMPKPTPILISLVPENRHFNTQPPHTLFQEVPYIYQSKSQTAVACPMFFSQIFFHPMPASNGCKHALHS